MRATLRMGDSGGRPRLAARLAAKAVGTALLLAAVVGSGILGERLAAGNAAVALLANTAATAAALHALIVVFGPISGAHFNPVVTSALAWPGDISCRDVLAYAAVQIVAAMAMARGRAAAAGVVGGARDGESAPPLALPPRPRAVRLPQPSRLLEMPRLVRERTLRQVNDPGSFEHQPEASRRLFNADRFRRGRGSKT